MLGLICYDKYPRAYPGAGKIVKYPTIVWEVGGLKINRVMALTLVV